jgi:lipoprotein NlpD
MADYLYQAQASHSTGRVSQAGLTLWLCLLLSGCGVNNSPAPVDSWQSRKATSKISQADTYQVKRGDTLFSIAFRNGMDYRSLARLNRIAEPYTIYVGQILVVSNNSAEAGGGRNPVTTSLRSNKNHSNSNSSDTASKSAKVVAPQNQKRYGQNERVEEPEKTANSTINGNVRQWHWPVKGPILAKFSSQEHGNKGLDIGGAYGTPVKAAAAGQVVYAGNALRGYGNLIIIKHNDDFLSAYAHNHRLLVKERESVAAGQTIAEMGNSDADRVQLHFEIRYRGKSVDPLRYLK